MHTRLVKNTLTLRAAVLGMALIVLCSGCQLEGGPGGASFSARTAAKAELFETADRRRPTSPTQRVDRATSTRETTRPNLAPQPARNSVIRTAAPDSEAADALPIVAGSVSEPGAADEERSWFPAPPTQRLSAPSGSNPARFAEAGDWNLEPLFPSRSERPLDLVDCSVDPPVGDAPLRGDPEDSAGLFSEDEICEQSTISSKDDALGLPSMLWNDTLSLFTWKNALVLGAAAGGAVAVRDNLDQPVRRETAEHPLRWGEGSKVLRQFGEYSYQVPVLAGVYGLSLWLEDERLHEFSKAVISAYAINAIATVAIKGVTNTQRPTDQFENGHYGFPSYHASSTFAIAAVADEYYGWPVGLPCYCLAGLVGWSRIDQREHDLSDVLFGSVLGFVIGKTIAAAHLERNASITVLPYYDPVYRASGVTFEKRF